jgi:hypothetical protein
MTGHIERIHEHTFVIRGDDGLAYFAYRASLDSFGVQFADLRPTMRVRFTPAESGRTKDDPRAVDVMVTDRSTLDGR